MKLFVSVCLFSLFILNALPGFPQKEVEISGVKYLLHTVKKSETAFSLCNEYKLTQNELNAANPGMTAVPKVGSVVKIPIKKEVSAQKTEPTIVKTVATEPEYYYHKVNKKQTVFSIARQYGITVDELTRNNPEISKGLVLGQVLKVPVKTKEAADSSVQAKTIDGNAKEAVSKTQSETGIRTYAVEVAEVTKDSENCNSIAGNNATKYKVGLLLPFYIKGNEQFNPSELNSETLLSKIDLSKATSNMSVVVTDSGTVVNGNNIDQRAQSFIEFYEGALLAIDSLQRKGMNIEMYVFDASNQSMVNALLQLDIFRDLNLIIGPVYPELQENVASFAAKNRILMVSPLASNGNFEENNPFYIKVNPTREFQIEQTANYIANEFINKNFVLLPMTGNSNSSEAKLAELGKTKLLEARKTAKNKNDLFHEYSFQQQGLNALDSLLDKTGENVFIVPTDNEAQVSVAVTNLNALAEKYNVVLIGTSNLTKMKSIQTENYHHIRLRYLSPYFIDYTKPLVRRFVSQYRETFSGEPSQFSYQGFDVSYYFLSALYRYGKDFRNCLSSYPMELTQMDFNFRRVTQLGGYMNQGLFVTAYEHNYDILNYGIVVPGQK